MRCSSVEVSSASPAPGARPSAGARVCVLERAEPPAGATNVAAGMLAPVGELTFGERELLELTLLSGALWPDFAAEVEAAGGGATGFRAVRRASTWRSTATRRASCAASTTCSGSSASRPSG